MDLRLRLLGGRSGSRSCGYSCRLLLLLLGSGRGRSSQETRLRGAQQVGRLSSESGRRAQHAEGGLDHGVRREAGHGRLGKGQAAD